MGTARTDDRLDHRAIQTLKRVLLRVEKVDGRLIEEDFWYQSPEGTYAPWLFGSKASAGSGGFSWDVAWEALQTSLAALESLTPFVKRGLHELLRRREQKACRILTLPDEILATIFQFACATEDAVFEPDLTDTSGLLALASLPMSLAATCRRFRRVALDAPSLWNLWQNVNSRGSELFQHRSGGRPLTVYINTDYHARRFWRDSEVQHRNNLRALVVERSGLQEMLADSDMPELAQTSSWRGASFPLLEELTVVYTQCLRMNKPHFFETWVMPRLNRFSILNFVPKGTSSTVLGTSLTSLRINFNLPTAFSVPAGDIDLLGFAKFLRSQRSLVDLTICFDVGMYQTPPLPRSATLPSLQSFRLHLGLKHSGSMTEYLLRSLQMPSLHNFYFTVECATENLERIMSYVLYSNSAFTKIQDFDFHIMLKPAYGSVDLSIVPDRLRSLRSLSITTPDDIPGPCSINMDRNLLAVIDSSREGERPNVPSPPLRFLERLRLHGSTFSPEFLPRLLRALAIEDPKHLDQLGEVVLRNCSSFNGCLEEVYKLVPSSRFIWLDDLPAP